MSRRITSLSTVANPQEFLISSEGVQVGSPILALPVTGSDLGATRLFYCDLPTGLGVANRYQFVLRQINSTVRNSGEFYWNGSDIVAGGEGGGGGGGSGLSATEVRAEVAAALADYSTAKLVNVTDAQAAVEAAIAALNNLSLAEVDGSVEAARDAVNASIAVLNNLSVADVTTPINAARDAVQANIATLPTNADIDTARDEVNTNTNAARDAVQADIAALSIPTVAEIEAALLNDGDGQAILDAIATAIENSLQNDSDGRTFLASIQSACASALANYGTSTATNVTDARDAVQVSIAGLNNLSAAQARAEAAAAIAASLVDTDAGSMPALSDLTAARDAVQASITALNNLSVADVTVPIDAARDAVQADIAALENLSAAEARTQVDDALAAFDPATAQDVLDSAGLTFDQDALLTQIDANTVFVKDVSEADEAYSTDTNRARKLLKGTSTVLVDKVVNTNTTVNVTTTLTEPSPP